MFLPQFRERPARFTLNRSHTLANGLVFAGLGCDPMTRTMFDSGPFVNDGTLTAMDPPTDWVWEPQLGRWRLDFDGSDDYIAMRAQWGTASNDVALTVSAWVKNPNNCLYCEGPAALYNRHYIYFVSRKITYDNYEPSSGAVGSTGAVSATAWAHVALCRNVGGALTFYINGVADSTASGDTYSRTDATLAWIGSRWGTNNLLTGSISDLIIHNRILYDSEISALADPSNVMLSGLIVPPVRRMWASVTAGAPATSAAARAMHYFRQMRT